jgi:hypothetical protein
VVDLAADGGRNTLKDSHHVGGYLEAGADFTDLRAS